MRFGFALFTLLGSSWGRFGPPLASFLFSFSIFDFFRSDFGAVSGSQMEPWGPGRAMLNGAWEISDGLGIDLVGLFFRVAARICFVDPLELFGAVLWCFLLHFGVSGVSWVPFGALQQACWNL